QLVDGLAIEGLEAEIVASGGHVPSCRAVKQVGRERLAAGGSDGGVALRAGLERDADHLNGPPVAADHSGGSSGAHVAHPLSMPSVGMAGVPASADFKD